MADMVGNISVMLHVDTKRMVCSLRALGRSLLMKQAVLLAPSVTVTLAQATRKAMEEGIIHE